MVDPSVPTPTVTTVAREWGRIGCIGFGGPPAHIRLLRQLCVEKRGWIEPGEFEDAIATCNLLPGPASTQLAIFCAWRVRGRAGAAIGGAAFIAPGLVLILLLASLFLGNPPRWVIAAGAGAGAAVAAVAVHAASSLIPTSWNRRDRSGRARHRWVGYVLVGAMTTILFGPWVVLALLCCGLVELSIQMRGQADASDSPAPRGTPSPMVLAAGTAGTATVATLAWVSLKVGALSYGGGFVIIPLMQGDAVGRYHWMTSGEFLNAVALGQVTPGPVVLTVAAVGYAAAGLAGGVLAAVIAFAPSFAFILLGADQFDRIRRDERARAFLEGAGPAAIGAILGSAVPLAAALSQPWQFGVLVAAGAMLILLRRGVVFTLVTAGLLGVAANLAGLAIPG